MRDFNAAVRAAGGTPVLFMTWEFERRPFLAELAASYDEIGRELGIAVIPIGRIYQECDVTPYSEADEGPDAKAPYWLTGGDLHQTQHGSAVNAYAVFSMLTGINPNGTNFVAGGNDNSDRIMRYFSEMAWVHVEKVLHAKAAPAPSAFVEAAPSDPVAYWTGPWTDILAGGPRRWKDGEERANYEVVYNVLAGAAVFAAGRARTSFFFVSLGDLLGQCQRPSAGGDLRGA